MYILHHTGSERMAVHSLRKSYGYYKDWEATRKLNQMLANHEELSDIRPQSPIHDPPLINTRFLQHSLDVIFTSMDSNRTVVNALNTIMDVSSATMSCFIVNDIVRAQCEANQSDYNIPLCNWNSGSILLVQHVMKSQQQIVLNCAYRDPFVKDDPFFALNKCKSVLCMPVIYKNQLQGVLYLSNHLISNCFDKSIQVILAVLVSQLACNLDHDKLVHQQMAQAAQYQKAMAQEQDNNRRKQEELIDRICHEIRNPVQGILGNCQLLQTIMLNLNHPDAQEMKSCVDSIAKCGRYQKMVTDDMLTMSKLESNKVELNPAPLLLCEVIDNVTTMNKIECERKGLTLTCSLSDDYYKTVVSIDGGRFTTVLMNLVTNAIKFTAKGHITITGSSEKVDNEISFVIQVRDTGCGITLDEQVNLFNKFHQTTEKVYSEYGGSGLGLFISKMIVELMGGNITVQSEKNVGSVFLVSFQCSVYQFLMAEETHALDTCVSVNKKIKVLIAEDNKINQRVVCRMMQLCGCDTSVAGNGEEAVEIFLQEGPFDMILMDVSMPVIDGYQCTEKIRQIEQANGVLQRTRIIGLSGNMSDEYHSMGKKSGMDQMKNKPISLDEIKKLIASIT
ncbi:hypothetical protein AKO1_007197 [Acrasis kona]|uniref:histidine kinase n=1 Tax=Acrasis kona TaxID=1008807 RepID=A0AAW2YS30_9EUKA